MSGYEVKGQTISLIAGAAVAKADRFKPVKISGNNTFTISTVAEDVVIGVVQNEAKLGEAAQIMIAGVTMFTATAVVAAGAAVGTWGIALTGATAIGDIIAVKIK